MAAGNATIGALKVDLGLNSANFTTGLKQAQGDLSAFGKNAAIAGAAIGAAIAAAGIAVSAAVKGAIDAADELSKTSQKIGVGVEALSALKYAGELADVSLDQLATGLKKLSVNMAEAAGKGTGKAAEAFRALGINVRDAAGNLRSSDAVFADVSESFSRMQDGAGKTALAVAIFGKAGADLIPLLNSGKAGLEEMRAEAEQLGIVISQQTATAAENFNDNLTRLKTVGQGLTTQLASAMLPALESVSAAMVGAAKNTAAMDEVGKVLAGTVRVLATAVVGTAGAFAYLGAIGSGVLQALNTPVTRAGDALKALDGAAARANAAARATGQAIRDIWSEANLAPLRKAEASPNGVAAPIVRGAEKAKAAAKDIKTDTEKAIEALQAYVKAEEKAFGERGLSSEQVKFREQLTKAAEAMRLGQEALADAIIAVATAYSLTADEAVKADAAQVEFLKTPASILPSAIDKFEQFAAKVAEIERTFYDTKYAVDDLFYGIKNNDWVGAFSGLIRAIQNIQAEFAKAGNLAGKIGAVAGAVSVVGGAIGGKAGGALSGAASGAAAGAAFGVPGAVIGGIIGGISGLFGASKAKKRAKKEAAARAKEEAERKAAELATASRALDIELLREQGKAQEALNAQREDELAAADPTLRERMKALYALQDLAVAEGARADIAREILRLTDATAAAEADRADVLAAMPESVRALQQAFWNLADAQDALTAAEENRDKVVADAEASMQKARDELADAYEREADALEDVADRFADLADELAAFKRELSTTDLGGGNAGQQAVATRAEFDRIAALAKTGDEGALAALPSVSRAYLDALRSTAPDQKSLAKGISEVSTAVTAAEASARSQVSNAQAQLFQLQESVKGLITLNQSVLTVKGAIDGLAATIIKAAEDQAAAMRAVAEASREAAAAAANASAKVNVGSFDAAAMQAAITAVPANDDRAFNAGVSDALVSGVEAALGPYLYAMVKTNSQIADLAQLSRDEADAA